MVREEVVEESTVVLRCSVDEELVLEQGRKWRPGERKEMMYRACMAAR